MRHQPGGVLLNHEILALQDFMTSPDSVGKVKQKEAPKNY
jgi:hypothetical protein